MVSTCSTCRACNMVRLTLGTKDSLMRDVRIELLPTPSAIRECAVHVGLTVADEHDAYEVSSRHGGMTGESGAVRLRRSSHGVRLRLPWLQILAEGDAGIWRGGRNEQGWFMQRR